MKKEVGRKMARTDLRREGDMATSIVTLVVQINFTNHVMIIVGGYFFDLSALKAAILFSCHMIACDYMYICFYFYNKACVT